MRYLQVTLYSRRANAREWAVRNAEPHDGSDKGWARASSVIEGKREAWAAAERETEFRVEGAMPIGDRVIDDPADRPAEIGYRPAARVPRRDGRAGKFLGL